MQKPYGTLFRSTFTLSACTFGGGYVIVPLMRKKFVEQLGWLTEQEMLDLTAIAQSAPGAIAVNASILVGYQVAGVLGALVTVLGTILPPLLIISAVSYFYDVVRDNVFVSMAMLGMQAGVAAIIVDVVLTMGRTVLSQRRVLPALVLAGSFAAVAVFGVNVLAVLLVCGLIGGIDLALREKKRPRDVNPIEKQEEDEP